MKRRQQVGCDCARGWLLGVTDLWTEPDTQEERQRREAAKRSHDMMRILDQQVSAKKVPRLWRYCLCYNIATSHWLWHGRQPRRQSDKQMSSNDSV